MMCWGQRTQNAVNTENYEFRIEITHMQERMVNICLKWKYKKNV